MIRATHHLGTETFAEEPTLKNLVAVRRGIGRVVKQESVVGFFCANCGNCLELHQPDPELTDCLLATCGECKSWYLTDPLGSKCLPVRKAGIRIGTHPRDRRAKSN